ncbi:uncharacterized protein LOC109715893 isoform X3 [Ananas comosus]|uniref:Uncharacterized protein LOC109715893 isoform X3 n=1 Tax=Ananas comosus TaxID=4615 RepID=A0A6P5FK59_ANACO|nr:uncharacterized protein LOC109715893 isoform X3 [Ananas comosus]
MRCCLRNEKYDQNDSFSASVITHFCFSLLVHARLLHVIHFYTDIISIWACIGNSVCRIKNTNIMSTSSPPVLLELSCERECSRGEDYRLIKLSIIDYTTKREKVVAVECRGHDAARFQSIDHAHGWEEDVIGMIKEKHGNEQISVSFECETLKADNAAEEHIRKYMPNLSGHDAVGK